MMRPLLLSTALALLSACATAPSTPSTASAAAKTPVGCVGQTATRIPVKDGTCAGFGSTYTKQDVDNTGQVSLDRALQMLDPSIGRH